MLLNVFVLFVFGLHICYSLPTDSYSISIYFDETNSAILNYTADCLQNLDSLVAEFCTKHNIVAGGEHIYDMLKKHVIENIVPSGDWPALETNYEQSTGLLRNTRIYNPIGSIGNDEISNDFSEPMRDIVTGKYAAIIIRNVLTPEECLSILHRMESRKVLVDGKSGEAAMEFPFRRLPFLTDIGITLVRYGITLVYNLLNAVYIMFFVLYCSMALIQAIGRTRGKKQLFVKMSYLPICLKPTKKNMLT
jgi:hypothetical protein